MRLDAESVAALWTAGKGLALAGFAAGAVYVGVSSDIDTLKTTKADKADVATVPAKLEAIDHRLERIERTLDRVDDKLDRKADKP